MLCLWVHGIQNFRIRHPVSFDLAGSGFGSGAPLDVLSYPDANTVFSFKRNVDKQRIDVVAKERNV